MYCWYGITMWYHIRFFNPHKKTLMVLIPSPELVLMNLASLADHGLRECCCCCCCWKVGWTIIEKSITIIVGGCKAGTGRAGRRAVWQPRRSPPRDLDTRSSSGGWETPCVPAVLNLPAAPCYSFSHFLHIHASCNSKLALTSAKF